MFDTKATWKDASICCIFRPATKHPNAGRNIQQVFIFSSVFTCHVHTNTHICSFMFSVDKREREREREKEREREMPRYVWALSA